MFKKLDEIQRRWLPVFFPARHKRFEAPARQLHGDLYRYAYWLCGDSHQAGDLVQQTFACAKQEPDLLREQDTLKTRLITLLRRNHVANYDITTPALFSDLDNLHEMPGAPPEENSMELYALRMVTAALEPLQREILALQIIWHFSSTEIAKILELPLNTVTNSLLQARRRLRHVPVAPRNIRNNNPLGRAS